MSDPITRDEELTQLRAENARLRAELESQGPVTVRMLAPETRAVMPTAVEMRELLAAVNTHWPRDFENVDLDEFGRAFRALATIHRQETLDSSHSPGHWVALANQRLYGQGATSYWPFLAAVAAWGDIPLTDWRLKETEGVPLEFGLNEYVGRLPRDEWRRTLAGEFVTPIDPRPKRHRASPEPSFVVDGKRLPDQLRYQGPRYWDEY